MTAVTGWESQPPLIAPAIGFPPSVGAAPANARSLRSFAAVGDGTTDDTAEILDALASGERLTGEGLTYAISENITPPDDTTTVDLSDASFLNLNPQTTSQNLLIRNNPKIRLRNIKIDRGTNMAVGSNGGAAGLSVFNCPDFLAEDIEVTGNGACKPIRLDTCSGNLVRPYIHDCFWSSPTDPGSEMIEGVYVISCTDLDIWAPRIDAIGGYIGANPLRYYQSDGLTFSTNTRIGVHGGHISRVGEGSDVSGGGENRHVWFYGVHYSDCDSYGLKFVHEANECGAVGCVSERAGFTGFIVGAANISHTRGARNIRFIGCTARDPGANSNWTGQVYSGYKVAGTQGSDPYLPEDIVFIGCTARDTQDVHTMAIGFYNEPNLRANARLIECFAEGTVNPVNGYNGFDDGGILTVPAVAPLAGAFLVAQSADAMVAPEWTRNLVAKHSFGRARTGLTLANGVNAAISLAPSSYFDISGPTGAFSICSIIPNLPEEEELVFFNTSVQPMTIVNEYGSEADVTHRINTFTGANVVLPAGRSLVKLSHDGAFQRWIIQGVWPHAI